MGGVLRLFGFFYVRFCFCWNPFLCESIESDWRECHGSWVEEYLEREILSPFNSLKTAFDDFFYEVFDFSEFVGITEGG